MCGQDGAGPVLTGHVGHLYLQALDVGHVHIEEGLGLGNGAPDAGQGDVGQAAAAVHCGDGGGEAARAPPAPPSQPAATFSELSAPPRRSNLTDMFQSVSHEALLSIWCW